jgi:hypothetical protein
MLNNIFNKTKAFPVEDFVVNFTLDSISRKETVKAINPFAAGCVVRVKYPGASVTCVTEAYLDWLFNSSNH